MAKQLLLLWVMWMDSVSWVLWRPLKPCRQICRGHWDGCSSVQGYGAQQNKTDDDRFHLGLRGFLLLAACTEKQSREQAAQQRQSVLDSALFWIHKELTYASNRLLSTCCRSMLCHDWRQGLAVCCWECMCHRDVHVCKCVFPYVCLVCVCLCVKESINSYIQQWCCLVQYTFVYVSYVFMSGVCSQKQHPFDR